MFPSSTHISWKLVRRADSWVPPQNYPTHNCGRGPTVCFSRLSGDFEEPLLHPWFLLWPFHASVFKPHVGSFTVESFVNSQFASDFNYFLFIIFFNFAHMREH